MSDSDAARWLRAKEVFGDLLGLPEDERRDAVSDRCGGDPELEREVLSLLTSHAVPVSPLDAVRRALSEGRGARSRRKDWIGEEVAGHRVVELLGRGGMGSVFRADPAEGGASVAIKVLHQDARSEVTLRRFAKERERLRGLDHPFIVKLLESGVTGDGTPYHVMELVDGEPIDRYADAERLTVDGRLRLLLEVCHAVAHAHAHDVVHRDLKPSNILIRRSGEPALVDFGIAKLLDPVLRGAPGEDTGAAPAYTVVYASPEQLEGEAVSPASDVYSLGIVGYELLTGLTPRMRNRTQQGTLGSTLARQGRGLAKVASARDTTPSELKRLLGGELETILVRACDPTPSARYQSVEELADELRRWLEEQSARPSRRRVGDWLSRLRNR